MSIATGALGWPGRYYTKPTSIENVANGHDNLEPWSSNFAYRNWTWKKTRNIRKKKGKDPHEERRLHRRRCCCCVLWWLTTLLLIILTLVLFMVFWFRAHRQP